MFELGKWYLDCIGDDGEVVIGYRAELRLGPLRLSYASVLSFTDAGGAHTATRFAATPRPVEEERGEVREVRWDAPAVGLSGTWRGRPHDVERTLWSSERGAVRWRSSQAVDDSYVTVGASSGGARPRRCVRRPRLPWREVRARLDLTPGDTRVSSGTGLRPTRCG